jgi:hypothetical protein
VDNLHLRIPQVENLTVEKEFIDLARNIVAGVFHEAAPFLEFLGGHIPVTIHQGFHIFEMARIRRMGQEPGVGEEGIEDQVVFMSMGSDQVMERSAVFEGPELPLVAGGVDDQPIPVFDQDGVTVGVSAAADEFYRAFGKIVHGNLRAINKMRWGHRA